jgi:serine/threonine protein kinase
VTGESASGRAGRTGWLLAGLTPGAVIAGYRLDARIGAGGMAMVFRARDEGLGRTVALKILAPTLAGDGTFRERFIRESQAAAAVDHPHIIPVFGAGEADGILYLAMRYVPGGDLRSVMYREGPLPAERAAFLLSPVASALDAAHAAGLIHRDVKPANVLVDTSPGRPDHPYLSDFGLAKGATSMAGLTGTGQFLGTAGLRRPRADLRRAGTRPDGPVRAGLRGVHDADRGAALRPSLGTISDPGGRGVNSLAFSVMGTQLAVADKNGTTYVWSLAG